MGAISVGISATMGEGTAGRELLSWHALLCSSADGSEAVADSVILHLLEENGSPDVGGLWGLSHLQDIVEALCL